MQRPAETSGVDLFTTVHEQFRFLDLVDDPFFPQEAASVLATFGDLNPVVDSRSEESVFARKIQATVILSGRADIRARDKLHQDPSFGSASVLR
jgi:hypothetical protein